MGKCKFSETCSIRRARALDDSAYCKRKGELAELVFVLKAASLGLAVCKPYGESLPFDFVVANGCHLLRIQVKSTFTAKNRGHTIHVGFRGRGLWHRPYTPDDIDFIAAYVAAYDVWYVIPVTAIGTNTSVRVYPDGPRKRDAGRFEIYRDAWNLILEAPAPSPPKPADPGPRVTSRL